MTFQNVCILSFWMPYECLYCLRLCLSFRENLARQHRFPFNILLSILLIMLLKMTFSCSFLDYLCFSSFCFIFRCNIRFFFDSFQNLPCFSLLCCFFFNFIISICIVFKITVYTDITLFSAHSHLLRVTCATLLFTGSSHPSERFFLVTTSSEI